MAAKKPARNSKRHGPVLGDVAAMPPPKDRESIRVRKIDNGFVICREGVKGGRYFETEHYSKTAPKINIPK